MRITHSIALATFVTLASQPASAVTLPWLPEALHDPFSTTKKASALIDPNLRPQHCDAWLDMSKPLHFEETVIASLCNNPETRAAYHGLMASAAIYGDSFSGFLPRIIADSGLSRTNFITKNEGVSHFIGRGSTVSASMLLYDFGQREANLSAAEQTLIAAGYNYDATLQGMIATTLNAYYRLLVAQQGVNVAKEIEAYSQKSYDAAKTRHSVGQVPAIDELQSKGSYSLAQLNTEQANNQLLQARASLNLLLGLSADTSIEVADADDAQLAKDPFGDKVQTLMKKAKTVRNDLIADRAQLESSKLGLEALQRADLPNIGVATHYSNDRSNPFNTSGGHSHGVSISVSFPIFTGFTQTYNERISHEFIAAQTEALHRTELAIEQDVWRTWYNYETAKQSWTTNLDLLATATKLKEVALGRYQEGLGTILDVLSAESQYSSALQNNLQSRYNLLVTRVDLVRAVGVLDLKTMNPESKINFEADDRHETH